MAAGEEDVRGAEDAVDGRLAGAVAVVEEVLGERLVDCHDRVHEGAVGGHGAQADHARGRLLSSREHAGKGVPPIAMEERDEVATVVLCQLRVRVNDRVQVAEVAIAVHGALGERADPVFDHERGGHVVLGGQRVRGAQGNLRTAGLQRPHQVRGLCRHVQARADAKAVERLLALETLADEAQDRHLSLGPLDARDAVAREADVGDIVGRQVRALGLGGSGQVGSGHTGSLLRTSSLPSWARMLSQGAPRRCARRSSKRQCSL